MPFLSVLQAEKRVLPQAGLQNQSTGHNCEVLALTEPWVRASNTDLQGEEGPGAEHPLSTENLLGREVQAAFWPLLASSSFPIC